MAGKNYKKRAGDRKEGRLLRTLPALNKFTPYIMPASNDACNFYEEDFEISKTENMLRSEHDSGYKDIGFLHFIIAAYVRCISMLPGINRFVAGRRIYARNNIEVIFKVKRESSVSSPEISVKVSFEPTDTIFDVYRKISENVEDIRASGGSGNLEATAEAFSHTPRFILRFAFFILRIMDYFGWLPNSLLQSSPYHGSLAITDMKSRHAGPVFHHISNFGTLPVCITYGSKYHKYGLDEDGTVQDRKCVDMKFVFDERIADGHYYSQFLQALRYIFEHPEILEVPPSRVVDDID